jgi:hypothetical protein
MHFLPQILAALALPLVDVDALSYADSAKNADVSRVEHISVERLSGEFMDGAECAVKYP